MTARIMPLRPRRIPEGLRRARAAWFAAAIGTPSPRAVVRRSAKGMTRTSWSASSASGPACPPIKDRVPSRKNKKGIGHWQDAPRPVRHSSESGGGRERAAGQGTGVVGRDRRARRTSAGHSAPHRSSVRTARRSVPTRCSAHAPRSRIATTWLIAPIIPRRQRGLFL